MTYQEHYERHFDDNRVITRECEECEQDDILTTVDYTVMGEGDEEGEDENLEHDLCSSCIESLKRNKLIIINQIR